MIYDRILRLIWGIFFLVIFICILLFNRDTTYSIIFGIGSGIVFIQDFQKFNRYYKKMKGEITLKRRWHMFANFSQWLFWTGLIYIPFISELSIKYKIFVLLDLFVISTFSLYKFIKCD